jgi:hypothetical protein
VKNGVLNFPQEDGLVLFRARQGAVPLILLLMVLLLPATGEAAAPNLVGTWQGSAPAINVGCSNEKVTITILQQCGNLCRGTVAVSGRNMEVVGKITDGAALYLHGMTVAAAEFLLLWGDYQAGSPPKINVTSLYYSDISWDYDAFQAIYGGGPVKKGDITPIDLLLLMEQ